MKESGEDEEEGDDFVESENEKSSSADSDEKSYSKNWKSRSRVKVKSQSTRCRAVRRDSTSNKIRKTRPVTFTEAEMTCIGCGQIFETLKELGTHSSTHLIEKPFKCSVCGKAFHQANGFRTHKRVRHEGYGRRQPLKRSVKIDWTPADHLCHYCGKKWETVEELISHKRVHFKATISKCEVCHTILNSAPGLRIHFQVAHLGIPHGGNNFQCLFYVSFW